ncbi:glycosyltransferase [Acinetobacter sp. SWAC5]|uniref:glycosyltransferase n=1 Tax=Acinetobacter sp. SWAC5 TaxID=2293835 RepID=UPI000E348782|nr:glycosyltransferase [Acinetobacter sp. SWAC5]RFS29455.1 glycosyltransferase [Acinetobacter sp. SWAC5]
MNLSIDGYEEYFGFTPLFIFPSKIVGGHELMTINIIKDLMDLNINVNVACDLKNSNLIKILNEMKISYFVLPCSQPHIEIIQTFFNIYRKIVLNNFLKKINWNSYSKIILVQGDIEIGGSILNYLYEKKIKFSSYIPYAHSAYIMDKKFSFIRDLLSKISYSRVFEFITINNDCAEKLKCINGESEIFLIKNKVRNIELYKEMRKSYLNERSDDKINIFLIGRIYFRQKGQDIFVEALSQANIDFSKVVVHIIGNGPDEEKLKKLFKLKCPHVKVTFYGWLSEPWDIAFKCDFLVMPSRFEGVPLVMLEAIELGIFVLASNRDGMKDYIDSNCLFSSTSDFVELINREIK